ncbi:hypothetical protein C1H46_035746 [Malus baccata]|uniref:Poly(A) polymerase nucleotidyltransferase domain-containing protein n=1 Tax=Malus baccata TaxID=106549 RepID=A0A540KWS5_MALBA|nr:hypothetical protein C1H46_035746 [Malus baccata]
MFWLYENKDEAAKREEVIGRIDQIVKGWVNVKQLTSQRGYTDQMVEDANAVIFTFEFYQFQRLLLVCMFCWNLELASGHWCWICYNFIESVLEDTSNSARALLRVLKLSDVKEENR